MDSVHSLCALWPTEGGAHLRSLLPKETNTNPLKRILSFCQYYNSKHVFREKTSKNKFFFLFFILCPTKTRPTSAPAQATHGHRRESTHAAPRDCGGSAQTVLEQPRDTARATPDGMRAAAEQRQAARCGIRQCPSGSAQRGSRQRRAASVSPVRHQGATCGIREPRAE